MGMPAARLTDMHVCPMVTGLVPHVGGPIIGPCALNVLIGSSLAARISDLAVCVGPPDMIVQGSATVLINSLPAARIGDKTIHGGVIVMGWPTVLIGDAGATGGGSGGAVPGGLADIGQMIAAALGAIVSSVTDAITGLFPPATPDTPATPGAALADAVAGVNPSGSVVNCGNIIDAAAARLSGADPKAVAPAGQDGSFTDIEGRFNTSLTWGSDFNTAFDAVRDGGDGTMAIVGIGYSGGTASHVVLLANDHGTVGIVEGQNWGPGNPPEVITDVARANTRYNSDGGSNIGWGLVKP